MVVVEDGTARQRMVAELGRYARDYHVESANGGDEAIARLGALRARGDAVAMVLADLALPPLNGVDVLTRVRSMAPTAKRILLVDWGLRPDQMPAVSRAAALGLADTVLSKPTGARDEEFHERDHRGPRRLGVDDDADGRGSEGGRRWRQRARR